TITVNPVSDAPVANSGTLVVNEDGEYGFQAPDFGFSDLDGDELVAVIITSLPEDGRLIYNGEDLTPDDLTGGGKSIPAAELDNLKFVPNEDYHGPASFNYKLVDAGDEDANTSAEATMTFTVTEVDDAPVATPETVNGAEDQTVALSAAHFGFSDIDGHSLVEVLITSLPGGGVLKHDGESIMSDMLQNGSYAISVDDIEGQKLTFEP